MPEQEPNLSRSAIDALRTFSFDIKAQSSGSSPQLETFQVATLPGMALDEMLFTASPPLQDSPDDLFSERFGVVRHGRISLDPQVVESLDTALAQVISEGLFDLDSAEPQGLAIRRGGYGSLSGALAVRWLSYTEAQTGSSLLPDFNALQAIANADSPKIEVDIQGVERFFSGEARILMIGEGEDIQLGLFVPAACRGEAIEHFIRAAAGSGEPSFLYNALEQEVVRVLDGDNPICSKDYQDALIWIRNNLSWLVVSFDSCVTCGATSERVVLELTMNEPENPAFLGTVVVPQLRCTASFDNPHGTLVERPTFQWAHINKNPDKA
jgi:hypothetical protein